MSQQASGVSALPPVPTITTSTPTPGAQSQGPVEYLQSSSALNSSGTIVAGTRRAIVAVMSGSFDAGASAFSSDTLSLSAGTTSQSVSRAPQSARFTAPRHRTPVEAFAADDGLLRARLRAAMPGAAARTQSFRAQSVLPPSLHVGSTASLWVQQGALSSNSRTNVQVPATLVAQTAHGNVWIDDSLNGSVPSSDYAQIAADFENAYASDTQHFASPDYASNAPGLQPQYRACAADGSAQGTTSAYVAEPADRRINVLVVNSQNLGGLGGYFSSVNFMPQSAVNCLGGSYHSNEAPFIFVGWFGSNGAAYELREDLVRGTAHELQHLINFVNHAILPPGASSTSFNGGEVPFVNEGLSMLAQDLAVERMYGSQGVRFDADDALERAGAYLANPQNFSVSGFMGIDSSAWGGDGSTAQFNCGGGCYGAAYLFERYMYDRFGADSYTHAMENSGEIGASNLSAVTGERANSLLDDFALAIAADSVGAPTSDRRFEFGTLNLEGAYPDQFGSQTTLDGVYASDAGATQTVTAPVGGFAFVSETTIPSSGLPVSITDRETAAGFGLEGGLAQH